MIGSGLALPYLRRGGGATVQYLNPLNLNTEMPKMDGVGAVSYDSKLWVTGGWNPNVGVFTPGPNTNQIWNSTDGYSYTQQADAPWDERHLHFCHNFNDKIFIGGGYGNAGVPLLDVWSYDTVNGWVEITSDWGGVGERAFFCSCIHNGKILVAGGQDDELGTTMFTDIWESSDGDTWTKLCDLPVALTHFSSGVIYSFNGNLYLVGGSQYSAGVPSNINIYTYVSTDNGDSWTDISTVPANMRGYFQNGAVWNGKMWYMCGYNSGANIKGLYSSEDGITWTAFYDSPAARHASGMCVHNSKLFIVTGNLWNDSWCVQLETERQDGYLSPLLTTWYNSLTVAPSDALTKRLSVLMDGLDSDGVLDETYLLAPVGFELETNEQRLKPLKTTSGDDLVAVNSPTIASTGITGNGTTSYVDLKWNMAVDHPGAAQNNISFAVWSETNTAEDAIEMGTFGPAFTPQSVIGKKYTDNNTYYSLNDTSNYAEQHNEDSEYYLLSINRNSGTERTILRGNTVIENASVSSAIVSLDTYGCCANNNGTAAFFSTKEQRLFFIGSGSARTWQLRQRLKFFLLDLV